LKSRLRKIIIGTRADDAVGIRLYDVEKTTDECKRVTSKQSEVLTEVRDE